VGIGQTYEFATEEKGRDQESGKKGLLGIAVWVMETVWQLIGCGVKKNLLG
jgi:hypothetical protein